MKLLCFFSVRFVRHCKRWMRLFRASIGLTQESLLWTAFLFKNKCLFKTYLQLRRGVGGGEGLEGSTGILYMNPRPRRRGPGGWCANRKTLILLPVGEVSLQFFLIYHLLYIGWLSFLCFCCLHGLYALRIIKNPKTVIKSIFIKGVPGNGKATLCIWNFVCDLAHQHNKQDALQCKII